MTPIFVSAALGLALFGLASPSQAAFAQQQLPGISSPRPGTRPAVAYLYPEQVTLPAGAPHAVDLHFRVEDGLHINSHAPGDTFLIPTVFAFPADPGATLNAVQYPGGREFSPADDPSTKLNVYTGAFVLHATVTAERGNHLVAATLRYQACDERACMPPKTITVPIDITGK